MTLEELKAILEDRVLSEGQVLAMIDDSMIVDFLINHSEPSALLTESIAGEKYAKIIVGDAVALFTSGEDSPDIAERIFAQRVKAALTEHITGMIMNDPEIKDRIIG